MINPDLENLKEALTGLPLIFESTIRDLIHYYETTNKIYRLPPDNDVKSVFYLPNGQTWEEHAEYLQNVISGTIDYIDQGQIEDDKIEEDFNNSELGRKFKEHMDFHDRIYEENEVLKRKRHRYDIEVKKNNEWIRTKLGSNQMYRTLKKAMKIVKTLKAKHSNIYTGIRVVDIYRNILLAEEINV
jgi:hypothetical protein